MAITLRAVRYAIAAAESRFLSILLRQSGAGVRRARGRLLCGQPWLAR